MTVSSGWDLASDAELITAVRSGDTVAFGVLYERHQPAARSVARQYSNSAADADDAVAETFSRVLAAIQGGGGPDVAFRAYLFTVLRRVALARVDSAKRAQPTDDVTTFEAAAGPGESTEEPAMAGFERSLVSGAYKSLPERWQAVLWYTEVENLTPAEIAPILGLTANGVAALAYRAREGLRQAYLQQHLAEPADEACTIVNKKLGAYVRGGLAKRETALVEAHLDECARCRALVLELGDVNHGMRAVVAPLVLGGIALAALQGVGFGGAAGAVAAGAAGGAGAGAGAGGAAGGGAAGGGAAGGGAASGGAAGGAAAGAGTGAGAAAGAGSAATAGAGAAAGAAGMSSAAAGVTAAAAGGLAVVAGVKGAPGAAAAGGGAAGTGAAGAAGAAGAGALGAGAAGAGAAVGAAATGGLLAGVPLAALGFGAAVVVAAGALAVGAATGIFDGDDGDPTVAEDGGGGGGSGDGDGGGSGSGSGGSGQGGTSDATGSPSAPPPDRAAPDDPTNIPDVSGGADGTEAGGPTSGDPRGTGSAGGTADGGAGGSGDGGSGPGDGGPDAGDPGSGDPGPGDPEGPEDPEDPVDPADPEDPEDPEPGTAVLAVSSDLDAAEFTLGELAPVRIAFRNTGTAPAAQVHAALAVEEGFALTVLESDDVTPVGFAPGATPWTCSPLPDGVLCSGPALAPGAALPLELQVVLERTTSDDDVPEDVDVGLAAWAGPASARPEPTWHDGRTLWPGLTVLDVGVTVPADLVAGGAGAGATVTVENRRGATFAGGTATITLPEHVTATGAGCAYRGPAAGGDRTFACDLGRVATGSAATIDLALTVDPDLRDVVTPGSVAVAVVGEDRVARAVTASSAPADVVVRSAPARLVATVARAGEPTGANVPMRVTVENLGGMTARAVPVEVTLPEHEGRTMRARGAWTEVRPGVVVRHVDVGFDAAGAPVPVVLDLGLQAPPGQFPSGTYPGSVRVDGGPPQAFEVDLRPDLSGSGASLATASLVAPATTELTFDVRNTGAAVAQDVVLEAHLPAGAAVVDAPGFVPAADGRWRRTVDVAPGTALTPAPVVVIAVADEVDGEVSGTVRTQIAHDGRTVAERTDGLVLASAPARLVLDAVTGPRELAGTRGGNVVVRLTNDGGTSVRATQVAVRVPAPLTVTDAAGWTRADDTWRRTVDVPRGGTAEVTLRVGGTDATARPAVVVTVPDAVPTQRTLDVATYTWCAPAWRMGWYAEGALASYAGSNYRRLIGWLPSLIAPPDFESGWERIEACRPRS